MVKTLGVTWLPDEDVFAFKGNPPDHELFELIKGNCAEHRQLFAQISSVGREVGYWTRLGRSFPGRLG